jgi:glycosyltransferase involved in cell wall biosynthesis
LKLTRLSGVRTSVAICTYHGAGYIAAQLQSIADQSCLPDEVVLVDDGSSDDTLAVVNRFAQSSSLPLEVHVNPRNLGVTRNFERAVQLCTGDVVFLCDQDDVWHSSKVEQMIRRFEANPEIGLVFSNASLVDASLRSLGETLWQALRLEQDERSQLLSPHAFDLLLRRYLVTGATMAFRRSYLEALVPFSKHLLHDAWITLILTAIGQIGMVDETLVDYRQHVSQQIGERDKMRSWWTQYKTARRMDANYFSKQLLAFTDVRDRVLDLRDSWVHPQIGKLAEDKVRHDASRMAIREARLRGLSQLVRELSAGRYHRFSYGWKSVAQDLFL